MNSQKVERVLDRLSNESFAMAGRSGFSSSSALCGDFFQATDVQALVRCHLVDTESRRLRLKSKKKNKIRTCAMSEALLECVYPPYTSICFSLCGTWLESGFIMD